MTVGLASGLVARVSLLSQVTLSVVHVWMDTDDVARIAATNPTGVAKGGATRSLPVREREEVQKVSRGQLSVDM